MKNLLAILNGELADGRATLEATCFDVKRAADFCKDNYMNGSNEGKLDHTMSMATRSLGTVAFHISQLANNFLDAMNLQSDMIADLSDRISKLQMIYNIHQEKVARKAIGACTGTKVPVTYSHEGTHPEPLQKYIRRPIDYTLLESIGHGVRTSKPATPADMINGPPVEGMNIQNAYFPGRQPSTISSRSTKGDYSAAIHSVSMPYQTGTLDRNAGNYRGMPQHLFNTPGVQGDNRPVQASPYAPSSAVAQCTSPSPPQPDMNLMHGTLRRSSGSSSVGSSVHYATNAQIQHQPYASQQHIFTGVPPMSQTRSAYGKSTEQNQRIVQAAAFQLPTMVQTTSAPNYGSSQQYTPQRNQAMGMGTGQQERFREDMMRQGAVDLADQMPLPPPEAYAESMPSTISQMGNMGPGENWVARKASDPPWAPEYYMEKVITLYEYLRDKDDELTFAENQIIYVVKKNDDGWWEGVMNGITGLFPGNYVELTD